MISTQAQADPYADSVGGYSPGREAEPPSNDPTRALGYSCPSTAMGYRGVLILNFLDNVLIASGDSRKDLEIKEIGSARESTKVDIGGNGGWIFVGETPGGTSSLDIDQASGVRAGDEFRTVRLTDSGPDRSSPPHGGADICGIKALITGPSVCKTCGPCRGGSEGVGNPCNPANGNKYQSETDYSSVDGELDIVRSYNSQNTRDIGFGHGWIAGFYKSVAVESSRAIVWQSTGRSEVFTLNGGNWSGDADTELSITQGSGFVVIDGSGSTESYDVDGVLLSETTANGHTTDYSYNDNDQLILATNHFGHTLSITWGANGHIHTITNPLGGVYTYSYDANDNLVGVDYPDTTSRSYHYETVNYPNHLTGIADENGVRYATFAYDSEGRAIRTEHADIGGGGAQEKFRINYGQ